MLAVAMAVGLASPALADNFNITDFSTAASSLTLNGVTTNTSFGTPLPFPATVAAITPGLPGDTGSTLSVSLPVGASAGSAWYNTKEDVGAGFITDFTFRIRDKAGLGANGFAFVIQNSGTDAIGAPGLGTGYADNPVFPTLGTGIASSLAVVFDTWDDHVETPLSGSGNLLTVQSLGLAPNSAFAAASLGSTTISTPFNDGGSHHVQILYIPGIGLSVYLDDQSVPSLSLNVDLASQLGLLDGNAYIGFTAATGSIADAQRHEILNWSYTGGDIPAPTGAAVLALSGWVGARRRRPR